MVRPLLVFILLTAVAQAQDTHVRVSPDVKTGIESTTEYPTIQMALDHAPEPASPSGRTIISIAPGTYHERIIVTRNHPRITLVGTGAKPADVVITNSLNAKTAGGTFVTATADLEGDDFEAANLTFENSAGNTGQAVAAAVRSDRAVFVNVRFIGDQDTLFADFGRQYYRDCYIEGGVDFIFGNATAVFDGSEIHAIRPGFLTAQSRTSPAQSSGYVILRSKVTAAFAPPAASADYPGAASAKAAGGTVYLGRPWRAYSCVIFLDDELPAQVNPEGWSKWTKNDNDKTAYYAEAGNTGPGAATGRRASWSHQLQADETKQYLPGRFLAGQDHWNAEAAAESLRRLEPRQ